MSAVISEKVVNVLLNDITRDTAEVIGKYQYTHPTMIPNNWYISMYHLVDISKKYKGLDEEGNQFGSSRDIDFGRFGRYTYFIFYDKVYLVELAAYKGRILRKQSQLIRTDDGKLIPCGVKGFVISSLHDEGCILNAAYKYKDEAIKEGLKELKKKYYFMKQLGEDIFDSIEHRSWEKLKFLRDSGQLFDYDINNIVSSVKMQFKNYMDEKLSSFNFYIRGKEQDESER